MTTNRVTVFPRGVVTHLSLTFQVSIMLRTLEELDDNFLVVIQLSQEQIHIVRLLTSAAGVAQSGLLCARLPGYVFGRTLVNSFIGFLCILDHQGPIV